MTRKEEPLPPSTLDMDSGRLAQVGLRAHARGVELLLFEALPRAKLHGLNFSAQERPSVIVGGRKQPVEGVY